MKIVQFWTPGLKWVKIISCLQDYDVAAASDQDRNQHLATYKRIGNDPPTIPKSTMHAGLEDALTSRRDYEAKKKNPVRPIF